MSFFLCVYNFNEIYHSAFKYIRLIINSSTMTKLVRLAVDVAAVKLQGKRPPQWVSSSDPSLLRLHPPSIYHELPGV